MRACISDSRGGADGRLPPIQRRPAGTAGSVPPCRADRRSMMNRLLNAEVRKLWTIWSTFRDLRDLVLIDLAFGFGARLRSRRPAWRHRRHRPPRLFPVVHQRVLRARQLATSRPRSRRAHHHRRVPAQDRDPDVPRRAASRPRGHRQDWGSASGPVSCWACSPC